MVNDLPLVSVLMTAYNREKYIADAIESVLASSYTNFELIIVDDGSMDSTVSIAKSFEAIDNRVKVFINETNLGDYVNRNRAATLASGKYLKYVDSDDLIYPYGLETMVNAMEKFPEAALGITSRNTIPLKPFPILLNPKEAYFNQYFEYGILDYGPTGVIIRTDIFKESGMFSGKRFIGDKECWLKMAAINPIVELPPALTFWRQHDSQEMKYEQKKVNNGDFLITYNLTVEVLSNVNCPLSEPEKKRVLKKQKRMYSRELIKYLIRTGHFLKASKLLLELKLSIKDLF